MPISPREFRFLHHDVAAPLREASSFLDLVLLRFKSANPALIRNAQQAKASAMKAGAASEKLNEASNREGMTKGNEVLDIDGPKAWARNLDAYLAHTDRMRKYIQSAARIHDRVLGRDATLDEFMDYASHNANLMHRISNSIKSRKPQRFSLSSFLKEALPAIKQTKLEVNIHPLPNRIFLKANSVELQRILINLARNADLRGKAKKLEVQAERKGDWLHLRVSNDGNQIPSDAQTRLFEEGFSTAGSTGLGLTLSRETARRHGGDLRLVESTPERTSFELTLPLRSLPMGHKNRRAFALRQRVKRKLMVRKQMP